MSVFVFTDLVGSTALKSSCPGRNQHERDQAYIELILNPHRERLKRGLEAKGGRIESNLGDGHFIVFDSPSGSIEIDAVEWAVDLQRCHEKEDPIKAPDGSRIRVKLGISWGGYPRQKDLVICQKVDIAARISDLANGGQILADGAFAAIVGSEGIFGIEVYPHGERNLKGIGKKEVFEILFNGRQPSPLRGDKSLRVSPSHAGEYKDDVFPGSGDLRVSTTKEIKPGVQLGRYQLLDRIGYGGMGEVWRARHCTMQSLAAVKVIKPDRIAYNSNTDLIQRFYREVVSTAKLRHPNIVSAFDASSGPSEEIHYLVLEYIDGLSLDKLIQSDRCMPIGAACEIIYQAALGLNCIHENGLVHRDIKPSNLMVEFSGSQSGIGPIVKILDLGLALLDADSDNRLTADDRQAIGTSDYMAPEQWESTSVDIRADIYSLGCTFYHLLSGKPPFAESQLKPRHAHASEPTPPLGDYIDLPQEIDSLLARMLAKDPNYRIATPSDIANALEAFRSPRELREVVNNAVTSDERRDTPRDSLRTTPRMPESSRPSTPVRAKRRRKLYVRMALSIAVLLVLAVPLSLEISSYWLEKRARIQALQFTFSTIPGLTGEWWFNEIPYFHPGVRYHIAQQLEKGNTEVFQVDLEALADELRGSDVSVVYEKLSTISDAYARQSENGVASTLASLTREDFSKLYKEDKQDVLIKQLESRRMQSTDPLIVHMRGVLQHVLADLNRVNWEEAQESYLTAMAAYEREGQFGLRALCASDYALLLRNNSGSGDFQQQYDSAVGSQKSGLFYCYARIETARGLVKTKSTNATRAFNDAQQEIERLNLHPKHPLRAYFHERKGWLLLEDWQPKRAQVQFRDSARIREHALANFNGQLTRMYANNLERYLFSLQGVGMAFHFMGEQRKALDGYADILTRIAEDPTGDAEMRLPNTFERMADCFLLSEALYHPDYFRSRNDPSLSKYPAIMALKQARDIARDLRFEYRDKAPYLIRIRCKLVIAYLAAGRRDEALEELEGISNQEGGLSKFGELLPFSEQEQKIYDVAKKLAESSQQVHNDEQSLRNHGLDACLKLVDGTIEDRITRENLGLYLYAFRTIAEQGSQRDDLIRRASAQLYQVIKFFKDNDTEIRQYLGRTTRAMLEADKNNVIAVRHARLMRELLSGLDSGS